MKATLALVKPGSPNLIFTSAAVPGTEAEHGTTKTVTGKRDRQRPVLQRRLPTGRVQSARSRRRMKREAIEGDAQRSLEHHRSFRGLRGHALPVQRRDLRACRERASRRRGNEERLHDRHRCHAALTRSKLRPSQTTTSVAARRVPSRRGRHHDLLAAGEGRVGLDQGAAGGSDRRQLGYSQHGFPPSGGVSQSRSPFADNRRRIRRRGGERDVGSPRLVRHRPAAHHGRPARAAARVRARTCRASSVERRR